jgi:hypothetical protein
VRNGVYGRYRVEENGMLGGRVESIWSRPVFDDDRTDILVFTDSLFCELAHDAPQIHGSTCSPHFEHVVGLGLTSLKEFSCGWAKRG